VVSTRHLVHTTDGNVIGEWGMRKWMQSDAKRLPSAPIYILHDSLRLALLEQLGGHDAVKWGHQLVDFKETEDGTVDLTFSKRRGQEPRQIL
jgi:hypothetical protein